MQNAVLPVSRRGFLGGVAATSSLGLLPGLLPAAFAQTGSVLRIATESDVLTWDPIAAIGSRMPILRSVFDSPFVQKPEDMSIVPHVVRDWEWLDAGRTLKLTFRDDVVFHNGDKLTAEDFKFTYFDRPQAEPRLALAGVFNGYISGIEVTSPTEAIVHWAKVMPIAIDWMGSLANFILPKAYFQSVGAEGFVQKPVGSGPYRLEEYQPGARIVLAANPDYWAGRPAHDTVIFDVVREPSARVAAVQSGQADLATALPVREALRLDALPGITGRVEPGVRVFSLLVRDIGGFEDERVRLAAHHAIDKQALSQALYGGVARPVSVIGIPEMPSYDPDFVFPYDPEKARALLAEAGYSPDKPVEITFYSLNGIFPNDWELSRAITGMWARVGINAKLEQMDIPKFYELNPAGRLPEAVFWGWAGPANDPEQFTGTLLNPDSQFSVIKREDMREKLTPLLGEFDREARMAGYTDAARYAVEKGYVIPLLQAVEGFAYKDDIDFTYYPTGYYEPWRIGRR